MVEGLNMTDRREIKKYCNYHGYSDVYPYEVIRVVSDQTVELREMDAVLDPSYKQDVIPGGFAGHTLNNGGDWIITSNETNPTVRARWSMTKNTWQTKHGFRMCMADNPRRFYDYNF